MTREVWHVVGYIQPSPDELLVLPIFECEKYAGEQFAQFTFSSVSSYFELSRVAADRFIRTKNPILADARSRLYIGLVLNERVQIVERSMSGEILKDVEFENLSQTAKLQYLDVCQENASYIRNKIVIDKSDFSFNATLSAQAFINKASSRTKPDIDQLSVLREILNCSKWVSGWTVSDVPDNLMDSLIEKLSISRVELDEMLRIEVNVIGPMALHEELPQFDIYRSLEELSSYGRQEIRIAMMLRAVLFEPLVGERLVQLYSCVTKFEALVVPLIIELARSVRSDTVRVREIRVARMVPKIFAKYFPIRRGRFIVDFLRVLGDYPLVREQLSMLYDTKRTTYGVGLYSQSIESLLVAADSAAVMLRERLPRP